MTMWAVTQTTRFKAAVAGAGIANWQSYYGQNKIDTWMLPFFGASVYDKPEAYSRSSPITMDRRRLERSRSMARICVSSLRWDRGRSLEGSSMDRSRPCGPRMDLASRFRTGTSS
jgi:hypothetical protein